MIDIYTKCKKLDEDTYAELKSRQGDISSLFPTFSDRVKLVGTSGGSHMNDARPPDTWHFKIASATIAGHKYNAYVRWKDLQDEIKAGVGDKDNWKTDGSGADYRKLARDVIANAEIEIGCSCPADLYYGGKYIRTKAGSNYGSPENRPPRVRNPREHGAYCKHLDLLMQTLPWFHSDMSKFIKDYYENDVAAVEKTMKPKPKEEPKKREPKVKSEPEREEPESDKEPEKDTEKKEVEPKKEEPKRKIGEKPTEPKRKIGEKPKEEEEK